MCKKDGSVSFTGAKSRICAFSPGLSFAQLRLSLADLSGYDVQEDLAIAMLRTCSLFQAMLFAQVSGTLSLPCSCSYAGQVQQEFEAGYVIPHSNTGILPLDSEEHFETFKVDHHSKFLSLFLLNRHSTQPLQGDKCGDVSIEI